MTLQRLVDDPEADLSEVALLRAGKSDGMSEDTRRKILASVGVGGALVGLSAVSEQAGKAVWPIWAKSGVLLGLLGGIAAVAGFLGFGSHAASVSSSGLSSDSSSVTVPVLTHAVVPKTGEQPRSTEPVYQTSQLPLAPAGSADLPAAKHHSAGATDPTLPGSQAVPNSATTPNSSTTQASGSLAAELGALHSAQAKLASGDAAGALRSVEQYRANFPQGKLATEATVVEIEALVALGQRTQAQKVAEPLLTSNSPYAARIRSLLGQR